ncbi:hypothetical protein [Candidatus Phytoplasma ziziphi]|uniref:hypothetical protein n=1 Tax=Ziziphus jujuba witches'-broom phytoplasma TaxID=135727 RepID=UPI001EDF631C|nr:hypothetical protein [Candidatus Phytoplasma ziziphi]
MEDAVEDNIFQKLDLFNEQRNILIFMIKNIKNMFKVKTSSNNYFNILLNIVIIPDIFIQNKKSWCPI